MAELTEGLTGWGRTCWSTSRVVGVRDPTEAAAAIRGAVGGTVLARGAGRSYGDAGLNGGGTVLRLPGAPVATVRDGGTITAAAGTSFASLLQSILPAGWLLPALPGTRHVTLGGAIATDVHGKNSQRDGALGRWVRSLNLVDGRGEVRTVSPERDPDAFWATVGGMGLTGVITEATVQLLPVQTSWLRLRRERYADLDGVLSAMAAEAPERYCVAWLDGFGRGAWSGRGVVEWADSAAVADLPPGERAAPLRYRPPPALPVPSAPMRVLPARAVAAYNALRWRRTPAAESSVVRLATYFHQLDALLGWNRLYGRAGFVQYHLLVPAEAAGLLREAVESLRLAGCPPFLAVLKRHGAADPSPLSFPKPGWSLALDLPADRPALRPVLRKLDERVAAAEGRVYLAKDSTLRPDLLAAMYPRLPEWCAIRERLDPDGRFGSDLGRRLRLSR